MSTKDDRALLEAAARAAGMPIEFTNGKPVPFFEDDVLIPAWNPLEDDGDALRLAVKMRIDLEFDTLNPIVEAYKRHDTEASEVHAEALTPDAFAGVRRAIVRAAASMANERE